MYEFAWFFGGVVAYKLCSHLLNVSSAINVLKSLQLNILNLLGAATEDIAFIKALKYKTLHESDWSWKDIEAVKNIDEQWFEEWQNDCVAKIRNSLPKHLQDIVVFTTWEDALEILTKTYNRKDKNL